MNVIRHENVGGAKQALPHDSVQEQFAKMQMKTIVEPARRPAFEGDCPENRGEPVIEFRGQSREMMPFRLHCQRHSFHSSERNGFENKAAIK